MKKFLALLLALTMALCLAACGDNSNQPAGSGSAAGSDDAAPSVKVGFIMLHDENSTYDLNFINGAKEACEALGITDYIIKTNIGEMQFIILINQCVGIVGNAVPRWLQIV